MKKGKNEKVNRHRHTMETCAEIGRPEWWAGSLACETTQSNSLLDWACSQLAKQGRAGIKCGWELKQWGDCHSPQSNHLQVRARGGGEVYPECGKWCGKRVHVWGMPMPNHFPPLALTRNCLWLRVLSHLPKVSWPFSALPADCMPDCSFKWIVRDANQVSSLVGKTTNWEEVKPAHWSCLLSSAHVFLFPHFFIFPFPYFPFLLLGEPPENAISGIPLSLSG